VNAADLVSIGMAVVQVANVRPDGGCSCRDRLDCRAPGKHPVGRDWLKRALANLERRPDWLPPYARLAPATSYGLIPVPGSGLLVIDRDDPTVALPMPETFEVHRASADPRKGHYYFRLAEDIDESEVPRAFGGGEVRIAGSGHVVGPGSRHVSGDLYEPNDADVGIADRVLIDALRASEPVRRGADGAVEAVEGSRHAWLTGQARKYRGWGWDADDIADQLRIDNDEKCVPPLDEREAEFDRMARWAVTNVAPDGVATVRWTNAGPKNRRRKERRDRPGWAR
jgi:Bifunctional DNA primase/polymerase, N-terminal